MVMELRSIASMVAQARWRGEVGGLVVESGLMEREYRWSRMSVDLGMLRVARISRNM